MGRLIDADKLRAQIEAHEIIKKFSITEYECGHNVGLCIGIDEVDAAETVEAIPISWIEAYADWLTTIPAPFAANDEKSIRAMLTKWRTNPELQKIGCNEDYCDL